MVLIEDDILLDRLILYIPWIKGLRRLDGTCAPAAFLAGLLAAPSITYVTHNPRRQHLRVWTGLSATLWLHLL